MSTEVKCPSCGHLFPIEEVMAEEYKKTLRQQMADYTKNKEAEFLKKEQDYLQKEKQQVLLFEKQLATEKSQLQKQLEESLKKSITTDFENQLKVLEIANQESGEKLKLARTKELEFLKKEAELKNKEAEMEISMQRKLQEERNSLTEQIRKQENEKSQLKDTEHQLRLKELEKQLEDQKKLADEMRRKAEQGSMQLQGEVQELILEELLRTSFPFDMISEVGKGVRGADCIQLVRNNSGQECGKIIYESKRTKDFGGDWIEKLKKDKISVGADVALIVTQCYPKGMDCFGEKDGVWICSFEELKAVAYILREGLIKLFSATKSQENRGDKMHMLYDYLTSSEFSSQWNAISEGFMSMKMSIQTERNAMEKMWKAREKQLEKVLLNAVHISGSVEGIAGKDIVKLNLTNDEDDALFLE
ncbi:MAG: DUF2130 domain-containing protein [Bacteroidetes bacterium]|nr:DUF2130 domain-containing protein [Bacteroidota bacterium]MBU1373652.1 DUF2130 domain-containing protein [Bacteroidota bacterium]MBU1485978.1 DUF2130 domain-containing protein [Bacteroidota bacterium]MBU1759646.1 DUF2130 domain-containing protein [Bacteroidota bacterium]MBU2045407.1 DUF2130 domain-containing protein [Bacteroidota bacterium]